MHKGRGQKEIDFFLVLGNFGSISSSFVLHLEEPRVMQDSSILRYLCSSCCQKFPETGDKNLLIPTFPTNLSQGACVQEKSYEENSI